MCHHCPRGIVRCKCCFQCQKHKCMQARVAIKCQTKYFVSFSIGCLFGLLDGLATAAVSIVLNLALALLMVTLTPCCNQHIYPNKPGCLKSSYAKGIDTKTAMPLFFHDIFDSIVNGCPFEMSTSCIVDMFTSLQRLIFKFQ